MRTSGGNYSRIHDSYGDSNVPESKAIKEKPVRSKKLQNHLKSEENRKETFSFWNKRNYQTIWKSEIQKTEFQKRKVIPDKFTGQHM